MKKLKLKLDGVKETLTRDQMKKIYGGYSDCAGCCCVHSCGGTDWDCGYSMAKAKSDAAKEGKCWCCDSCSAPAPCEC
ncbi:hypothetical protein SAMN05216490_3470 [Mucilaginibacter mallensis]|uniref:Natural product n=1 Tax=Mucilaginibacter mallensis TaxID=652787 RepID=A0A1H2AC83_MUCMA|nr:hypothetical protein SAMN05216490_3470 [Mucilaginibacter mallensis]